jgi:tetratricopeptide (TPR) repeat protein
MTAKETADAIPVALLVPTRLEAAANLLDQAVRAGCHDPQAAYLLALAYKRQGKPADARAALRKIGRPDAGVFLQLGLLSLEEGQLAQAEQDFARAWQMDPTSYPAGRNLLFTRLSLDRIDDAEALIASVLPLQSSPEDQRFLVLLQGLLRTCQSAAGDAHFEPVLVEMTSAEEQRLVQLARSLGQIDTALTLLKTLAAARRGSAAVQEAYLEAVLVKGRTLMERCSWGEAKRVLSPLLRHRGTSRSLQVLLLNLLGCCACMNQDFDHGVEHFEAALRHANNDPRLQQNLALAHELRGRFADAEPHWNRFFDLLERQEPVAPEQLLFEGLNRLAACHSEKDRWQNALGYLRRAHQLRPRNTEVLERLFHLHHHLRRPEDARRVLQKLRELKPGEPQYDLYEIDLIEVKSLNDIDRVLTEIDRVLKKHPDEARVEERAVNMVGSVLPLMNNICEQLNGQLSKVLGQVRNLPNYQINWSAVHDTMRDLLREYQRLRRISSKCLPLVKSEEHRRIVREMTEHIDSKIEVCQSMSG